MLLAIQLALITKSWWLPRSDPTLFTCTPRSAVLRCLRFAPLPVRSPLAHALALLLRFARPSMLVIDQLRSPSVPGAQHPTLISEMGPVSPGVWSLSPHPRHIAVRSIHNRETANTPPPSALSTRLSARWLSNGGNGGLTTGAIDPKIALRPHRTVTRVLSDRDWESPQSPSRKSHFATDVSAPLSAGFFLL